MAKRKQRPSRSNRDDLLASVYLDFKGAHLVNDGNPHLYYTPYGDVVPGQQYANPVKDGNYQFIESSIYSKNRKALVNDLVKHKNPAYLKGVLAGDEIERKRRRNRK